jgi:hypothetical protein
MWRYEKKTLTQRKIKNNSSSDIFKEYPTAMAFTIDSARGIFPGTLAADAVPATIARFNQLSAEDQLALIWFA